MRRLVFLELAIVAFVTTARGDVTWYGGIEIGPTGVKMVAIPMDAQGRPIAAKIIEVETPSAPGRDAGANPNAAIEALRKKLRQPVILRGGGEVGRFADAEITRAAGAVKACYEHLLGMGIVPEHLWIVASSELDFGADEANVMKLTQAIKGAIGGDEGLIRLKRDEEIMLMIRGAVPADALGDAVLVDVSAHDHPKVGFYTPPAPNAFEEFQLLVGAVDAPESFVQKVRATPEGRKAMNLARFAKVADALRAEYVATIVEKSRRRAGIINAKHVYVSGDVAQAIIVLTDPEAATSQELRVSLSAKAIRDFIKRLSVAEAIDPPDMVGKPAEVVEKANRQIDESRRKFTPETLLAGAEILLAFAEALEWEKLDKIVMYSKPGPAAWVLGLAEEKRAKPQPKP